ncbi:MAG: ArnT family glycosyltransferase [Candidatus Bathyarchaeia archaeon]
MPDLRVKFTAAGVELRAPSFGRRFYALMILALLFLLALATRTYRLYSFPYFPEEAPWLGSNPEGLYRDEADPYLRLSESLFDKLPVYQPPFFLLFLNLSVKALGSPYAVRLPSAIASSFTAVLVYLVSMRKFGRRGASIASSLYFIAMFPAFVYNRMAFLENGVALFLLASYYCLLVYEGCQEEKWLYLSGIFSALAALSKINGVVAPLFLLAYGLHKGFFMRAFKVIVLVFAISVVSFLTALLVMGVDLTPLFAMGLHPLAMATQWWMGLVGRETSAWQFFIINTMPSGYLMWFLGYLRPEYWYIFAYFALAYLAVKEYEKVSDIILLIASFVGLCLLVWGIGSYYIIVLQPFFAIPVGYALKRMLRMQPHVAMMFLLFLYAPMAMTFNISVFGEGVYPRFDLALYLLKLLLVGAPLASAFYLLVRGHEAGEMRRTLFNGAILGLFLALLLVGSYLSPAFYPHYLSVGSRGSA